MDEVIRNLGPVIGVWLIALLGWWDIRRMHRGRRAAEKPSHDAAE